MTAATTTTTADTTMTAAARPTTAENPLALENQVCFQVAVAARSVLGVYRPILEPLGLTHPQYLVMLVLWENGDRSVRDIGTALRLDSATLSPLLKRLESAGLVRRARSGDDERVVVVSLTDEGAALRQRALEVRPRPPRARGPARRTLRLHHRRGRPRPPLTRAVCEADRANAGRV
jgi:DNA-binding MarR family transcriptional regulator